MVRVVVFFLFCVKIKEMHATSLKCALFFAGHCILYTNYTLLLIIHYTIINKLTALSVHYSIHYYQYLHYIKTVHCTLYTIKSLLVYYTPLILYKYQYIVQYTLLLVYTKSNTV